MPLLTSYVSQYTGILIVGICISLECGIYAHSLSALVFTGPEQSRFLILEHVIVQESLLPISGQASGCNELYISLLVV